jgi:carbon-monoxide dehydrogenase iron sulfur subunit
MVKKRIIINASKNILKAYKGEYPRPASAIVFEQKGHISFALQCRNCEEPPCVEACLTGAMYLDEEKGYVLHNRDGVIKPDLENKVVASKCDLCIEAEYPACVAHCPNEAIKLVEIDG